MLEVNNLNVFYGKVQALFDVSIEVNENEIISIIGANGAGKTTLMKTIAGINKPSSGQIVYKGNEISNLPAHKIVRKKLVYIPEGREIFPQMTVKENLEMGAYADRMTASELNGLLQEQYKLFPRLEEREKQHAGSLSGGEQQMLAIARGLMSKPELLMLDEPSLGLAPVIVDEVFDTIIQINKNLKIPIVIVEQNAFMAMSISDRTYVLEVGHMTTSGKSDDLMESPAIKKAYLGG